MNHPTLGEVNDLVDRQPHHQFFPGRNQGCWFYPPPRGRWVWIPDLVDDGMCDACRRGGVCMCVRPGRELTSWNAPVYDTYECSVVAHVGQH